MYGFEKDLACAELVIFDLDGTIVEFATDWNELKRELHRFVSQIYGANISFNYLSVGLDALETSFGRRALDKAYSIIRKYEAQGADEAILCKPIDNLIKSLYKSGKKLAVFSANQHVTACSVLRKFYLDSYFQMIVGADDVINRKPHPEGLLMILQHFLIPCNQAIYIGNREDDLKSGGQAGITTYLIPDFPVKP